MRPEIKHRKPFLKAWPGTVSLIEPALGSTFGVADAWVAYRGFGVQVEGWLEFKSPDERGWFDIRADQRLWHRQQLEQSDNLAFVVVNEEAFWIVPSRAALLHCCVLSAPVRGITWATVAEVTTPTFLPNLVSAAFDANFHE